MKQKTVGPCSSVQCHSLFREVLSCVKEGSDSITLKSPFFLVKQGFLCLIAMKVGRLVENMNSQLLMKKILKIFLKSGTEHAPKI